MDARFVQAHKEARWSMVLAVCYLATWVATSWLAGSEAGVTGLPRWFEISCLFVPALFIFLCWVMIRGVFRDISLEDDSGN